MVRPPVRCRQSVTLGAGVEGGRFGEQCRPGLGPAEVQLDVELQHEPVASVVVEAPVAAWRAASALKAQARAASSGARPGSSTAAQAASRASRPPPSTAVAASARPWATAWKEPIGTPKAWRSFTYSTPISSERVPRPVRALAISTNHSSRACSNAPIPPGPDARSTASGATSRSATGREPRLSTAVRASPMADDHNRPPSAKTTVSATDPDGTMVSTPCRGGCNARVVKQSPASVGARTDAVSLLPTRASSRAATWASSSGAEPRNRPCCSATRARSNREAPDPPDASSTAISSAPASWSRRHRSESCPDGSAARTRSDDDSLA